MGYCNRPGVGVLLVMREGWVRRFLIETLQGLNAAGYG